MFYRDKEKQETTSGEEKKVNVEFVEHPDEKAATEAPSKAEPVAEAPEPDVQEKLKAYEEKIKELEEKNLRLLAEFQNYRRRVEREQLELADYIKGEIFKKLLPVLDDFKIMMEKAVAGENEKSVLEGARIIYEKLKGILEKEGLEKIESLGEKFDPEIHEALMTRPTEQKEDHERVVEVYQEGYRLKEKLLRPSKVIVGKYSGGEAEGSDSR
ncbi:MAG: nucleotide exchange factor GrpE [Calditrichaeota bacterium]|nr:nucleotide exchange factor GrpE [Calditrichota bacterium]